MRNFDTMALSTFVVMLFSLVVFNMVVCTRTLVSSTSNGDMDMDMYVTVRKKRSEDLDFTVINRYICPPSLCRFYDENTKDFKPRPRGTAGTIFYQGDIILDEKMTSIVYKDEKQRRRKRATMKPRRRLWKNGIVKYKFAKGISSQAKKALNDAMEHIKNRTCIQFEKKKKGDEHFIRFISEPGCWSQIGKVGGVQLVSLGSGCESLGTAVHEIVHALGMWHEQARPDRNKNVMILKRNISPKFLPDFEMVGRTISTSRGYPYDYRSLMHYSKYAFTRNGNPTIEVIGKGKALKLQIGQRRGLSTIDIAQLRDMYKCNFRTDVEQTTCSKGWKKRDLSCYKFFPTTKALFGPAAAMCKELGSHLLMIEEKREQRFLDRYLVNKFPDVLTWRMAGKLVEGQMMWFEDQGNYKNLTYTNWAKHNPSSYSSAILKRTKRNTFVWHGEWLGSYVQKPRFEHAYICEKAATRKCYPGNYADGRDYRGKMDFTRNGHTCQKWTENYPRNHSLYEVAKKAARSKDKTDENGLGDHNYCRNPSGKRKSKPWCYTTKKKTTWDFCDVPVCVKSVKRFQRRQMRKQSTRTNAKANRRRQNISSPSSLRSPKNAETNKTMSALSSQTKQTDNLKQRQHKKEKRNKKSKSQDKKKKHKRRHRNKSRS